MGVVFLLTRYGYSRSTGWHDLFSSFFDLPIVVALSFSFNALSIFL
jgi:hypothetical protein